MIDYSIVIMNISRNIPTLVHGLEDTYSLVSSGTLLLLYAGLMLVNALAALMFCSFMIKMALRRLCGLR